MNNFELAKESFSEALKTSNAVTAVSRSFNKSIAAYCLAAYIDGTPQGEEIGKLKFVLIFFLEKPNARVKQNQKEIK